MKIPYEVIKIIQKLKEQNYKAYIVGGAIRNSLLGYDYNDYDLATNANPKEIISILNKYEFDTQNSDLGCLVYRENNCKIEITTFRIEQYDFSTRIPTVIKFVDDYYKDVKRRDFTINALYYDIDDGIIDIVDGMNDIYNKEIRCIGNPDIRFLEDPLRILRALRISIEYDLQIENNTYKSIVKNINFIHKIHNTKLFEELKKIILNDNFYKSLNLYNILYVSLFKEINKHFDINKEYISENSILYNNLSISIHEVKSYIHKLAFLLLFLDENNNYYASIHFLSKFSIKKSIQNKIIKIIKNVKYVLNCVEITNGIFVLFDNKYDAITCLKFCFEFISQIDSCDKRINEIAILINLIHNNEFSNKIDINGRDIMNLLPNILPQQIRFLLLNIKEHIIDGKLKNNKSEIIYYIKHNLVKNK